MKNVTISMDDDLHRKVRVDAAKAGLSVSRYISEILRQVQPDRSQEAEIRRRLDALQKVFDGPTMAISVNGRMPSADQRNARR